MSNQKGVFVLFLLATMSVGTNSKFSMNCDCGVRNLDGDSEKDCQESARLESQDARARAHDTRSVCSTLIGRAMSRLGSHWSRASPVMLAPALLCHKEPARASKAPY